MPGRWTLSTRGRAGLVYLAVTVVQSCSRGQEAVFCPPAVVDNPGMAQGRGVPQIDQALEAVVGAIDALTERQDGGPGVVLTLGGLVVSGTIIPDWQWFHDVEHAARAAFVVHVGGCIDDEHGGWARLFKGAAESLANDHAERRAAREVTEGLPDRYQRLVAQQRSDHLHPLDRGPGSGSRGQSTARCRDALARTALRNFGVVLRSSWR